MEIARAARWLLGAGVERIFTALARNDENRARVGNAPAPRRASRVTKQAPFTDHLRWSKHDDDDDEDDHEDDDDDDDE